MATMKVQEGAGVLTTARPRSTWGWKLVALGGVVLLAVLAILYFMMMQRMRDANTPPPGLDTSWTQTSSKGLYRSTVAPSIEPIAINQMHSWRLHLETADGKPVDDASFTIDGDMPGHGLPTQPAVTQKLGKRKELTRWRAERMTAKEAMAALSIHKYQLDNWVASGKLRRSEGTRKGGGMLWLTRESVEAVKSSLQG